MKEQIEAVKEEVKNAEVVIATLIMGFIHARNVCHKEVITFNRLWEEEEARLIIREEKMGATEDQDHTIERRYFK